VPLYSDEHNAVRRYRADSKKWADWKHYVRERRAFWSRALQCSWPTGALFQCWDCRVDLPAWADQTTHSSSRCAAY